MNPESLATWEQVVSDVERLRLDGAERFDPAAYRFVQSLVERAATLTGGARDHLVAKAAGRARTLEQAMREACSRAEALVQTAGGGSVERAREAMQSGDYKNAIRLAERAQAAGGQAEDTSQRAWLQSLADRARSEGMQLPLALAHEVDAAVAGGAVGSVPGLSAALSTAMYRQAATEMSAMIAAVHSAETLPDTVGPYNSLALSVRTLQLLSDLSPSYLRALVQRLHDLSVLQRMPEPKRPKVGRGRKR